MTIAQPLNGIIEAFKERQPMRAKSLVITFFGDVVSQHGKQIWLGSITSALEGLGIELVVPMMCQDRISIPSWLGGCSLDCPTYPDPAGDFLMSPEAHNSILELLGVPSRPSPLRFSRRGDLVGRLLRDSSARPVYAVRCTGSRSEVTYAFVRRRSPEARDGAAAGRDHRAEEVAVAG